MSELLASAPEPAVPARGADDLGAWLARFDHAVDRQLERIRGNRIADSVMVAATTLGDFSLIWHTANAARGATHDRRARQAVVFAALLGAESLVVNQGLKRLFNRRRPLPAGDPRYDIRRPLTSAFPSGHASAAGFTATMLSALDGPRWRPLWWGAAVTVATSRAYVRIHHPSDVIAGLAVGAGLAKLTRWAVREWLR